jgi:hypothetical protein
MNEAILEALSLRAVVVGILCTHLASAWMVSCPVLPHLHLPTSFSAIGLGVLSHFFFLASIVSSYLAFGLYCRA